MSNERASMKTTDTNTGCGCSCPNTAPDAERRALLKNALRLAVAAPLLASGLPAIAQGTSRAKAPQVGDKLAFMVGDKAGQEILPEDMKVGEEPVLAYPMDPVSGEVQTSRAGLLTVARFNIEELGADSAKNSVDGIVAFSSLCTHYGCPVTALDPSRKQLVCTCHGSVFDPATRGGVTQGPATRRLAMLPLELKDGALVIAGAFDGPIGPPT